MMKLEEPKSPNGDCVGVGVGFGLAVGVAVGFGPGFAVGVAVGFGPGIGASVEFGFGFSGR